MNGRRLCLALCAGLAALAPVTLATREAGAQTPPLAGSQGTDTALPATDSQVVVNGRGRFSDLRITVNQTRDLGNQAVSITWTGGTPTQGPASRFEAHYLQIFQCWGDDDGSVPENPGPPPEQCVQGAMRGAADGGFNGALTGSGSYALDRVIAPAAWRPVEPPVGVKTPDGWVWRPFRAVDGTQTDAQVNFRCQQGAACDFWLNDSFDILTTNEIGAARTAPDGTGAELLELQTGVQQSALGCGQQKQQVPGGFKEPQCWIVIVPRGAPIDENVNTAPNYEGEFANDDPVVTSPLSPQAWPNRIAIPLEFKPVDSPCSIDVASRSMSGSELARLAIQSWQPELCRSGERPPYSFSAVADAAARQQLARGSVSMAVVSRPLPPATDPNKAVAYAPLALSGVVIGFNIERTPSPTNASAESQLLSGIRVAELNLTPRLVAKLLTSSYSNQVDVGFRQSPYEWSAANPAHLYADPDFLQFNPEFTQLTMAQGRQLSGLHLPVGNSDAILQMWEWILADPEAKAWVDGAADEWGMVVNPAFAPVTAAAVDSFPRADPYCYQAPRESNGTPAFDPPRLCTIDWMPYATSFESSAANTRRANDGARIGPDPSPSVPAVYWKRSLPQLIGQRGFMSVTDSASAARYGIQTARLSRAGDNRPGRTFVAADPAGLTAGVASMVPSSEPQVLVPNQSAQSADAYPLTTLTYGAVVPLALDQRARDEYAAFVEYAAGAGQNAGQESGDLPRGYAPLPPAMRQQAVAAAETIRTQVAVAPTTTVATTVAPSTTSTTASGAGGGNPFDDDPVPAAGNNQQSGSSGSPSGSNTATSTSTSTTSTTSTTLAPESADAEASASGAPSETAATPPTSEPGESPSVPATTSPPGVTPGTDISPMRFAMAGFAGSGLLAALVALEITKLLRRGSGESAPTLDDAAEGEGS